MKKFASVPPLLVNNVNFTPVNCISRNNFEHNSNILIHFCYFMATAISIEKIKSKRNKDKAIAEGFLYNLNRINGEVYYWVCEKRGECNARINTRNDIIIKPTDIIQLVNDHTHAPSQERIEMLQAYSTIKSTAEISEQSTRAILSTSLQTMHSSIINTFIKIESVKRTIRDTKAPLLKVVDTRETQLKLSYQININKQVKVIHFYCSIQDMETNKELSCMLPPNSCPS